MDPLTVGISKLSLQPGDMLVVNLPLDFYTDEVMVRVRDHVQEAIPDCKVIVATGIDFTILRGATVVEPEVDPAVVVEVTA